MKEKNMLLIYNPYSGKGRFKLKLGDVIELYRAKGYKLTVFPTKKEKDATSIVKKHGQHHDIVVCSGGDGTISEVISGVMALNAPPLIGYIPTGTVNDFAKGFSLSKNILQGAKTVVEGIPYAFDVGLLNNDTFSYVAAFGLFTDVAYKTPQQAKNFLGKMAYLLQGAKSLANIKGFDLTVKTKGETVEGEFCYGMVTNAVSVGGFKSFLGKSIELNDGLFEVALAKKPKNPAGYNAMIQCMLSGYPDPEFIYTTKTSKIEIQSSEGIDWTLDGEFGGNTKRAVISNCKQAASIMVNKFKSNKLNVGQEEALEIQA